MSWSTAPELLLSDFKKGSNDTLSPASVEEFRGFPSGATEVYDGGGNLVLNGTDSSSTNAGDNFDLEGATGITF